MKKLFRYALLSAMAVCGTAAMAETTVVGDEDNSTGWWSAFSDYYTIEPNKTLTLKFQNFSSKVDNWNNWTAVVTSDADRNAEGYSEYLVMRCDNFGWGNSYAVPFLSSNYNSVTFKDDMDGSKVTMTVTRDNAKATVHADIETTSGSTYFEDYVLYLSDASQNIRIFLTLDGAHLLIDNDATTITDTAVASQESPIGNQNLSSGWWSAHSPLNTVEANKTLHLEFTNFTAGEANYQNWVAVISNGKYVGEDGYAEYLVLRSDNFGWAAKYDDDRVMSHYRVNPIPGFDELTDEEEKANLYWGTFRSEMQGAHVAIDVARYGTTLKFKAIATALNGEQWIETFEHENFATADETLGLFFTVDGSFLVFDDSKTTITDTPAPTPTGINAVSTAGNSRAARYNLAGQQVAADYKGVVIENGRKLVVK